MVLRHSHVPSLCLSSLVNYGWEFSNVLLVLIIVDDLLAQRFVTIVPRRSHLASHCLSSLVKYCWEFFNGLLVLIMADNL